MCVRSMNTGLEKKMFTPGWDDFPKSCSKPVLYFKDRYYVSTSHVFKDLYLFPLRRWHLGDLRRAYIQKSVSTVAL